VLPTGLLGALSGGAARFDSGRPARLLLIHYLATTIISRGSSASFQ
jgi:hypothetical protein